MDYIKTYINPKSPLYSTIIINYNSSSVNIEMYNEINHQLSYLLDEIIQLDPKYLNPEDYKIKYCQSAMNYEEFLKFKTYELVLFIEKSWLRKTKNIKIHWLLN